MKNTLLIVFSTILLVFGTGCQKMPSYYVQREASIQQLGVCVDYAETEVPYQMRTQFDQVLAQFIEKYNAENHAFKLATCQNPEQMSLRLTVHQSKLVTQNQQSTAVAVSLLGLATPIAMAGLGSPIILTFWYFPDTKSVVETSLSPDLRAGVAPNILGFVSNSGFLRSPEKQVIKHSEAFERYLRFHLDQVEKAYLKSKTTPPGTPIR